LTPEGKFRKGAVEAASSKRTTCGGNLWAIRSLTASEDLSCWDVPEKLGQLSGSDNGRREIMKDMFTPVKIRQAVLEDLTPIIDGLLAPRKGMSDNKRKSLTEVVLRGPTLKLTSTKEERETIKNEGAPPRNLLIEALGSLTTTKSPPDVPSTGLFEPTSATKDDKAPVMPEKWDKMLFLGLPEHSRAKPWARAIRTIRPLIARHWRRLQLRKWIGYVKSKHQRLETVSEADKAGARDCLLLGFKQLPFGSGNRDHALCFGTTLLSNKSRCETEYSCG
jgi:hypothetical protein